MSDIKRPLRPDETMQIDASEVELRDLAPRSPRMTPPPLPPSAAPPAFVAQPPPGAMPPMFATAPPPVAAKRSGAMIVLGVVFVALLVGAIAAGLRVGKSVRAKSAAGPGASGSVMARGAVGSAAAGVSASSQTLEIPMVEVSGP